MSNNNYINARVLITIRTSVHSDENIEKMRTIIEKIAAKYDVEFMHTNVSSIVFEKPLSDEDLKKPLSSGAIDFQDVRDELEDALKKCGCKIEEFILQKISQVYAEFINVRKIIGGRLFLEYLEKVGYKTDDLDYKAIALADFSEYYGMDGFY